MHKQWMGASAQNFRPGRGGVPVKAVVVHRSGGSLDDLDARFAKAGAFNSAHYGIGLDGVVHQYVEESDTAFHAGVVVNSAWPLLEPGRNPNLYTIGIELAGSAGAAVSAEQYDAAAALIAEIAARSNFTADEAHVVPHSAIRAGRECPGGGFDLQQLLGRIQTPAAQAPKGQPAAEHEVRILHNANVREGAPSTAVRIVRVAPANTVEVVAGFTDQGERISGNSYWYRTLDGNYFWAGGTAAPNPEVLVSPQPIPLPVAAAAPPAPAAPARCGIARIDQLFAGAAREPITAEESDRMAIGAVQDLLTGLGSKGLPTVLSADYGVFGSKTVAAVAWFRGQQGLDGAPEITGDLLRKMVAAPAPDPRGSTVYLALALGLPPSGMQRIVSLVSQMEGAGKFAALNRNTDRAGLSFGLIQWAQKPGRLAGLLAMMAEADRDQFAAIFGGGDPATADGLIAHCRKPFGGVDPKIGDTVNPSFDLVQDPWVSRFRQAALTQRFQQVQVQAALAAFNASYAALGRLAPGLRSERAVAFMLDVANQFGDGGTAKVYIDVHRDGMSETELIEAIADETVERMPDALQAGVRARRDHFLKTDLLTDDPFVAGEEARMAKAG